MADPVAIVDRIVKIRLKIKEAADKAHQNEEVCREIRKRVLRFSAILSRLQQQTGMADSDPAMSGALQDLEATLERALELVTACQDRSILRRLVTAGVLAKQLRGVNDDISNKVMLASFAINTHTTIILLTNQAGVRRPPPRQPEDTGLMEISHNHSPDDARYQQDGAENDIVSGSQGSFAPLVGALRKFRLSELKTATDRFSDAKAIGSGGSVTVYKGVLNDQNVVAIKKLRSEPRLGWAHTYNQLLLASKLQHRNIVKVLGYTHEDEDTSFLAWLRGRKSRNRETRYIWVEEYMPMGNLHDIIYNQELRPDWSTLIRIIEGVAQGVHYLHEHRILHLDLKPANILLDCHMNPKITDFDLARLLGDNDNESTHVNPNTIGMDLETTDFGLIEAMDDKMTTNVTGIAGTFGYLAPEYVINGTVSAKRDVYAFGITLLETVGCIRSRFNGSRDHPIGRWAWEAWEDGLLEEEFDPELFDEYQLGEIKRCIEVGLLCAQSDRADRPSMADVVAMLNAEKELPTPKKPEYIRLGKGRRSASFNLSQGRRSASSSLSQQAESRLNPLQSLASSGRSSFTVLSTVDLSDYNYFLDETEEDDLIGMVEHQSQQHDLQQRELQQQHREDQLKRWEEDLNWREQYLKRQEEEVHLREVQLLRRRAALLGGQEVQANKNRKYPRWTQ
ncbi:G-type lectin S-receptor-like serine/threonine-protein kinase At1g11330 isoform X3 [Panicum virgatum]|uniref:G-type lectin S-receptor-like serine/threonine-protein kinase At1g11330 isoform X3 n=1 Tax=Panicum virgatum TaxID=38727 RepID=UPI0019D52CE2|nr:G-type lectin S-receptor-like serine/threonine-protein kinase At1g11330 isoform X3 [Panicum virgatum]